MAASRNLPAAVELEVNTPWVIAGLQNDLVDFSDNREGAVVSGWFWRIGQADETRIMVSRDNGRSWQQAWENTEFIGAIPFRVDLTRWVEGGYGYRVRFEFVDRSGSGRVGLQGLELDTWVELSPMALPRLEPGANTFTLATGQHRAVLEECRWFEGESLPDQQLQGLALQAEGEPRLRPLMPAGTGTLIFSPGAAGIVDELRFSMIVRPLPGGKIQDASAVLSFSDNGGASWQELERFAPHPEQSFSAMYFNHILTGRSFDGARGRLRLELTGCGLERVTANSLVRVSPRAPSTLKVSHLYQLNGKRNTISWLFPPRPRMATTRSRWARAGCPTRRS